MSIHLHIQSTIPELITSSRYRSGNRSAIRFITSLPASLRTPPLPDLEGPAFAPWLLDREVPWTRLGGIREVPALVVVVLPGLFKRDPWLLPLPLWLPPLLRLAIAALVRSASSRSTSWR